MDTIKLTSPFLSHEFKIAEFKNEFKGKPIPGSSGLENFDSYPDWYLDLILKSSLDITAKDGVRSTTYLAIRESDEKIIGIVNIRHNLNKHLSRRGGHVGYSVRESERNKGYAKQILGQALEICKVLEIENALITCSVENPASEKVILFNGGEYESTEFDSKNNIDYKRFWIGLKT